MNIMNQVHPDARIGNNVKIGSFTVIHENVEIGDNCEIANGVTIFPGARIGSGVKIFPGAVIAGIPQDLKFRGEDTVAIIGDGTTIRECATVNRGTASRGFTKVGENCLIMAYTHIAHDCVIGNRVIISNATQLAGEVIVDDYAVIGGGSLVHQFCHLGRNIMLQGGALVNKDIPPFIKAAREPISFIGLNTVGMHRNGFSKEKIQEITEVYRILYMSDLNVTNAVRVIRETIPTSEVRDEILDFVEHSERGIIRSAF
ncbi:MAG: acyl-ACP--UDP-N-acetylglucosamine O-acyltransferase [Bacteroides sp.]|nr:acyl-ACP--UDP-N-acetylglucosamine O-acyltransferase [Bacteroides sp.]MDE7510329.1 acyl-ACP--UDP-N-acetylglucosamine O-acyltransferase [Muribaculaceae bacterium]